MKESDRSIACTPLAASPAHLWKHLLHIFGSIACTSLAASPAPHLWQHSLHFCSIACTTFGSTACTSAASPAPHLWQQSPAHLWQHRLHTFGSIACTPLAASPALLLQHRLHTFCSYLEETSFITEAFISSPRRYITRRGRPNTIYSDNGTNCQGAVNELQEDDTMLQPHPDSQSPRLPDHRMMPMEIHPSTRTTFRGPLGSSRQVRQIPPETHLACKHCITRRTLPYCLR